MHSEHREQGLLIPSLRFFITTANKDETGKRLRSGKWLGSCPHYEKPSAEHQLNPFTLQAFGTAPVAKGVVGLSVWHPRARVGASELCRSGVRMDKNAV